MMTSRDWSGISIPIVLDTKLEADNEGPKRQCTICKAFLRSSNKGTVCSCHPKEPQHDDGGESGIPSENTRSRRPIQPPRDQVLPENPPKGNSPLADAILDLVSQEYFTTREILLSGGRTRTQQVILARHIAMFLMRELDIPAAEIADIFGYSKHSVFYAIGNLRKIKHEPTIAEVLARVRKGIKHKAWVQI